MKKQDSYAHLVAGFVAKGNVVQVCAPGADSGISSRDRSKAVRGETVAVAVAVASSVRENRDSEALHHQMHDTATEARMNGHRVSGFDTKGNIYTDRGRY